MSDRKFCKFIGMDISQNTEILREICLMCNVDSLHQIHEYEATKNIMENFLNVTSSSVDEPYLKFLYEMITQLDNYLNDFDIARFLLVGSEFSVIEKKEYAVQSKMPFGLAKKNNKYITTAWCRSYKECMREDSRKHFFDVDGTWIDEFISDGKYKPGRNRIEKYSYSRMRRLKKELNSKIEADKNELKSFDELKSQIYEFDSDRKNVLACTTEDGIENLLVLDMTFGLSLTNVLYHHLKNEDENTIYKCIPLINELVKLRCFNLRNQVADYSFEYIRRNDFSISSITVMTRFAEEIFPKVNDMYSYFLHVKWNGVCQNIKELGKKEVWEGWIEENIFGISELQNKYEKEIEKDERMQRDMDIIPESKLEIHTWMELAQKYKIDNVDTEKIEKEIQKVDEVKWNEKEEIRSNTKISSKSEKYTKIHEIVMIFTVRELLE